MMSAMGRPRAAWLVALGLLGAGWVTAHMLSYMLVVPAAERGQLLAHTGHSYFRAADLRILCVTITLAGLALYVIGGQAGRAPSPGALALLPPIGFVVQEHAERLAVSGAFPAHLVAEPRFLVGLLLQIPFALAALVCARLLVTFARRLARRLGGTERPKLVSVELSSPPLTNGHRPRLSALALGPGERGPPLAETL
jgi:hypothetical protein